uniref:Mfa2 n=1 Tax=Kwoniella heveanensis TaxID=89924 RepID=D1MBK7_9TREE|nr:Mfa2 [Kwoniella heveanensis]
MDAFTAIFTTLSSSASGNTESPRDQEYGSSGGGYSCIIA